MPKAFTLGNGKILICFDKYAQVRDFYFPRVGLENHVSGHHVHRIGIWADGSMKWFEDPSWNISMTCNIDTGTCDVTAVNNGLKVLVTLNDIIYNEENIFVRKVTVKNLQDNDREIKMFFAQQFQISESRRGDTAYYDPRCRALIHYKGSRVFLINTQYGTKSFDDYTTGLFEIEGKEGSHLDALDGQLSKNPIEHGSADSVLGMTLEISGRGSETFHYWIAAAKSISEVRELNTYVLKKTPDHLMTTTKDYWNAWVNRKNFSFHGLSDEIQHLFKQSLLIVRSHEDESGAIIASGDSDMLQHGRDTYSYMWPRDGAFAALALARAGSLSSARRFFEFCNRVISDEGYFMHKYLADGSLGSSWHPWIRDGKPELPIQEDETASVLYALWEYYRFSKDLEFIESIYSSLIESAADFLIHYTYRDTNLPYPSYDLWEEKYGVSTYTCSAVYGALMAAANFAKLLGKHGAEKRYLSSAEKIKKAIIKYLYCDDINMFCKLTQIEGNKINHDKTIDMSSFYGIFQFGVLDVFDPKMQKCIQTIEKELCLHNNITGVPRYVGDKYYRINDDAPSNPWFITTLWLAQFYIKEAKSEKDLKVVKACFDWVQKYSLPSGILSEQLNPFTGEQVSSAPLTWSHATFVTTVIDYLEKLEKLGICDASNTV